MKLNLDLLTSMLLAMEELRGETEKPTLASLDNFTEGEADELLALIDRNIVRIKKLLDQAAASCSSSISIECDEDDESVKYVENCVDSVRPTKDDRRIEINVA